MSRNQRHKQFSRAVPDKLWLYGKHSVFAALANPKRKIYQVLATRNVSREFADKLPNNVEIVDDRKISHYVGADAVHQGIAIEVAPLNDGSFERREQGRLVVLLDQVTDPHNIGAVMRSASAFGASTVVTTFRNTPGEGGVLAKSASGALEYVDYVRVKNLGEAIEFLKTRHYVIAGLDGEATEPVSKLATYERLAIIMGAEGKGMRQKTRELCDVLVRIPINNIQESLNVSNAAAVALWEASKYTGKS